MYLLHVSNKLELAMKIKNIELTFPEEGVNIDPHLKVSCIAIQIVVLFISCGHNCISNFSFAASAQEDAGQGLSHAHYIGGDCS